MTKLLALALGATLVVGACGSNSSDTVIPADPGAEAAAPAVNGTAPAAAPGASPGAATPLAATPRASEPAPVAARQTAARDRPRQASFRELTIPAGTTLTLRLTTPVASDTSRIEDAVGAEFVGAVLVDGVQVVPAGARAAGIVTAADASARVKGRALITLQFTSVQTGGDRYDMRSEPVSWLAPATKGEDAVKIGIGAGAGAALGAILGGKSGAAKGAAVGGAAGTGVVLATRGEEVRLTVGTDVTTTLSAPLTVRLNVSE